MVSPFFTERNSPRLGTVNPEHDAGYGISLPNPRVAPGVSLLPPTTLSGTPIMPRGYLGRFDPKTGKFSEWASPSGPQSRPVRNHSCRQHYLVCRNRDETEHAGSVRPEDGEIPKLAGKGGRRNPAHLCGRGRKIVVYPSSDQWHRACDDQGTIDFSFCLGD